MSHWVDTPERKAALATSDDLATIRAAARAQRVGMRRLRWRVQGRICFTFQPYGTPYRDWGSLGRVYLTDDAVLEQAQYLGAEPGTAAELAEALAMRAPIGTGLAVVQPGTAVAVPLDVLDAITLDLAAEPTVEERVRDPETGTIDIVVTETYLPDLLPDPEEPDVPALEDMRSLPPWEPTVRGSWLFAALAFLLGLLGLGMVVGAMGLFEQGWRGAGFLGIGGSVAFFLGVWGVITAVRWNDRALALRHVSRETSTALHV